MKANITRVLEPIANFSAGPEPPRFRPGYLQASTKDLKLPKGFLYGVSTSSTQVEGAVKEGGRGPRYGHLCEMRGLPIPLTLFALPATTILGVIPFPYSAMVPLRTSQSTNITSTNRTYKGSKLWVLIRTVSLSPGLGSFHSEIKRVPPVRQASSL